MGALGLASSLALLLAVQPQVAGAPTWQQMPFPYETVASVAFAPDDEQSVYATGSNPATGESGAFHSSDAGMTWRLLAPALPGDTASSIAVDPGDASRLYATTYRYEAGLPTTRIYTSPDAGISWWLTGEFADSCGGKFIAGPSSGGEIYLDTGCAGHFFVSADRGLTWDRRADAFEVTAGRNGVLYGVLDGIVRSSDGGRSWTPMGANPAACPFVAALAADPDVSERLYAGTGQVRMIFTVCGGLYRSDDAGGIWSGIPTEPVSSLAVDATDPSRVFAAFWFGSVALSRDSGLHWSMLPPLNGGAPSLTLSASGQILFGAPSGGLYRMTFRKPRALEPR